MVYIFIILELFSSYHMIWYHKSCADLGENNAFIICLQTKFDKEGKVTSFGEYL